MITNSRKTNSACIILAAGQSQRFGTNKLLSSFKGSSLFFYVIDLVLSFKIAHKIIIVVRERDERNLRKKYCNNKDVEVVLGGKNRIESTLNGLLSLDTKKYQYVYVHDGARPIISKRDFSVLKREMMSKDLDGVVLYTRAYDSTVLYEEKIENNHYLDKNKVLHLKTPHLYRVDSILESLLKYKRRGQELENAQILSEQGKKIGFVEGSIDNIKVTYKKDISIIKKLV